MIKFSRTLLLSLILTTLLLIVKFSLGHYLPLKLYQVEIEVESSTPSSIVMAFGNRDEEASASSRLNRGKNKIIVNLSEKIFKSKLEVNYIRVDFEDIILKNKYQIHTIKLISPLTRKVLLNLEKVTMKIQKTNQIAIESKGKENASLIVEGDDPYFLLSIPPISDRVEAKAAAKINRYIYLYDHLNILILFINILILFNFLIRRYFSPLKEFVTSIKVFDKEWTEQLLPFKTKILYFILITLFSSYGLFTTFHSAQNVKSTFDEATYKEWGSLILEKRPSLPSEIETDHAPFFMWMGALPVHLTKIRSDFNYRIYHFTLYVLVGLTISFILWKCVHPFSSLLFALFFNSEPTLKAMASLHANDADVALYLALSMVLLYAAWIRKKNDFLFTIQIILSSLFLGFSIISKISAAVTLPIYFILFLFLPPLFLKSKKPLDFLTLLIIGVIPIFITYFYMPKFALFKFWQIVSIQLGHNGRGHETFLFNQFTRTGFWYYFIVLYLLKTPLIHLISHMGVLFYISKTSHFFKKYFKVIFCFYLPSLILFLFLSSGHIHIGHRYLLPAVLLGLIGTSIILKDCYLYSKSKLKGFSLLLVILIAFLGDFRTYSNFEYISYFNFLTPSPTRNFCDSNNHWYQELSDKFIKWKREATLVQNLDFISFMEGPNKSQSLYSGVSDLCGLGNPIAPYFRFFNYTFTSLDHEFYTITPLELYMALSQYSHDKDLIKNSLKSLYIYPLNFSSLSKEYCSNEAKLVLRNKDLMNEFYNLTLSYKTVEGVEKFKNFKDFKSFQKYLSQNSINDKIDFSKNILLSGKVQKLPGDKKLIIGNSSKRFRFSLNEQLIFEDFTNGWSWKSIDDKFFLSKYDGRFDSLNFSIRPSPNLKSLAEGFQSRLSLFWIDCLL